MGIIDDDGDVSDDDSGGVQVTTRLRASGVDGGDGKGC